MVLPTTHSTIQQYHLVNRRYRLEHLLGEGASGVVYQAYDEHLQRKVALKYLKHRNQNDQNQVLRFKAEAITVSQLKHTHVLTIFDYGSTQEGFYLVSELLTGHALRDELGRRGRLHEEEVLDLFIPICDALDEIHSANIIHRDLKPDNLFFYQSNQERRLVILDFGIAKSSHNVVETMKGDLFGTPQYIAPEQIECTKDVDLRSDIYSLGVILYECLTGRTPFMNMAGIVKLFDAHLNAPPTALVEHGVTLRGDWQPLIDQLLAKRPHERPESTLEVKRALISIKNHLLHTRQWRSEHLLPVQSIREVEQSRRDQDSHQETLDAPEHLDLRVSEHELELTLDSSSHLIAGTLDASAERSVELLEETLGASIESSLGSRSFNDSESTSVPSQYETSELSSAQSQTADLSERSGQSNQRAHPAEPPAEVIDETFKARAQSQDVVLSPDDETHAPHGTHYSSTLEPRDELVESMSPKRSGLSSLWLTISLLGGLVGAYYIGTQSQSPSTLEHTTVAKRDAARTSSSTSSVTPVAQKASSSNMSAASTSGDEVTSAQTRVVHKDDAHQVISAQGNSMSASPDTSVTHRAPPAKIKPLSRSQLPSKKTRHNATSTVISARQAKRSRAPEKRLKRLSKYLKIRAKTKVEHAPGDRIKFAVYFRGKKLKRSAYTLKFTPTNWAQYTRNRLSISADAPKSGAVKVCLKPKPNRNSLCKTARFKIQSLAELDLLP